MTDRDAVPQGLFEELHALTAASLSGEIAPPQRMRLEALLENPVAVDLYLEIIDETSTLLAWADYPGLSASDLAEAADRLQGKQPIATARESADWPQSRRVGVAVALSLAIALATFVVLMSNFGPAPDPPTSVAASVARLVRTYDCVWSGTEHSLADGDRLEVGKRIELRTGLVEIVFDCGARVILQGPAVLVPESDRGGSLSSGKITVRADGPAAKGFAIRTPAMKTIDLGTEFGLEVSPAGVEQVHVFCGQVEVAASSERGPSAPPQRLVEKQGLEVDPNTKGVKLVANNGERFARSLDEAQNRRHVVAWWRFEDHPVGVLVPESHRGTTPIRGSLDSSINGNDLYTWSKGTQPAFSSEVPAATIQRTAEPNLASLDNSNPPDSHPTRDLFTRSDWSRPSPVDLQSITPTTWTVEASVNVAMLRADYQTFVVRDGADVSAADPKLAPLSFSITSQRRFEIKYCDVDGRDHTATCADLAVEENHWYHVAAASDGNTLRLYVDSLDGNGYRLRSITNLPKSGSTALVRGAWPTGGVPDLRHRSIWSVGRGCHDGQVCRWFQGWIDEVRICDAALGPADFLFAKRPENGTK